MDIDNKIPELNEPGAADKHEVLLWDRPVTCLGVDLSSKTDLTAFTVSVEPNFIGKKTFTYFGDDRTYEVSVTATLTEREDE